MPSELYERGAKIRREVLGDAYVSQSTQTEDFMLPVAQLSTEFCWGSVWARDDLPRKTRSLLNISMLSALNRPSELKLHMRAALNNGCTKEEIRGVIMQVAVYCGVPAAAEAVRLAKEVFREASV
jgi:4-carboxymuconolactone decarboxylase